MCDNNVGVAKRVDLESVSKDLAELVKQLGKQAERPVQVNDLKKVETSRDMSGTRPLVLSSRSRM
jgi:hypothetical protein